MLNAAIVGLGWWGKTITDRMTQSDELRVTRAVDLFPQNHAAYTEKYGVPVCSDYAEVLADPSIDAVILTTPNSLHTAQVAAAAKAGKHVFCEKPLALNRREAEASVAICAVHGVRLHFRLKLSQQQQRETVRRMHALCREQVLMPPARDVHLSWDDARTMRPLVTFGCHSFSHPVLACLTDAELFIEIADSKQALSERLGDVEWFAYPYGYPSSFDARATRLLKQCGYQGAFTTLPVKAELPLKDPYQIPRLAVSDHSIQEFLDLCGER
jgi:hypothetical protein